MKEVTIILRISIVSEQNLSVLKSELLRNNKTEFAAKSLVLQYSFFFKHINSLKVNWTIQITA